MRLILAAIAVITIGIASPALASGGDKKETAFERAIREAPERVRAESRGGPVRDDRHDGRFKIDKDTSVGGTIEKGGATVNVRSTK